MRPCTVKGRVLPDCPFCGYEIGRSGPRYLCDNIDVRPKLHKYFVYFDGTVITNEIFMIDINNSMCKVNIYPLQKLIDVTFSSSLRCDFEIEVIDQKKIRSRYVKFSIQKPTAVQHYGCKNYA